MAKRNVEAPPTGLRQQMIEWVLAGISGLVVVALCAFLAYEAITARDGAADIVVSVEPSVRLASGTFAVPVTAHNRGTASAAQVEIEGSARGVTGRVTIDFLPAGGNAGATLLFPADPTGLAVRVTGYVDP